MRRNVQTRRWVWHSNGPATWLARCGEWRLEVSLTGTPEEPYIVVDVSSFGSGHAMARRIARVTCPDLGPSYRFQTAEKVGDQYRDPEKALQTKPRPYKPRM